MIGKNPRIRNLALIALMLLFSLFLACGGDDDDSANPPASSDGCGGGDSQEVVAPLLDVENTTGVTLEEPIIDGGEFGGKITINVTNDSGELCGGLSVNLDLLSPDGSVISNVALVADGDLAAGAKDSFTNRYIGAGVVDTRLSAITCDNTGASHGAPQSPSK